MFKAVTAYDLPDPVGLSAIAEGNVGARWIADLQDLVSDLSPHGRLVLPKH